jgi:hypothetical protein
MMASRAEKGWRINIRNKLPNGRIKEAEIIPKDSPDENTIAKIAMTIHGVSGFFYPGKKEYIEIKGDYFSMIFKFFMDDRPAIKEDVDETFDTISDIHG